jgi:GT2 family glycosyltransferase
MVAAVPELLTDDAPRPAGARPFDARQVPALSAATAPGSRPPEVSVVLVVRNGAAWLPGSLDALATQTHRPRRLLVVDLQSTDSSIAIVRAHQAVRRAVPDVDVLTLPAATPPGRAVDRAIRSLPRAAARRQLVWVLTDDAAPEPAALHRLVETLRRSESVGIAGPKVVDRDDPRRLLEMGIQVTRSGRLISSPAPGEPDQGQHDTRTDVLAVGACGLLIDRGVHTDLDGFDESFERYGGALDLGWRAQLAGHRVVVVPSPVVRRPSEPRPGGPNHRELERRTRRATRQVALARSAPLAAPFLGAWMALSSVVAAIALLVAKRPRQAWRELSDIGALLRPAAITSARARGAATKRLRRSHLATLFVTPGTAARTTIDHIQDAITPERRGQRQDAALSTETGPVGEQSESLDVLPASLPHRIVTHPGVVAVLLLLLVSVIAWRDPIRAGALTAGRTGVAGGELYPVSTGASGLWHAFRDAWHGSGLGSGLDAGPALAVLAGLTWLVERIPGLGEGRSPAGVTIAWLLFLAPALSGWSAYRAARVVTRSRVPRAVASAVWGLSAVLTAGVTEGRLGAVLAHVLLPFVLAGFMLAARRDTSFTATFASALAIAVVGAFVPPLLALSVVAAFVLLVVAPGLRRAHALVLLVVPAALLGPWLQRFLDDWRRLLSAPGLLDTAPAPSPVDLLLGQPDSGGGPWTWGLAPLVLLGIVGYALRSRSRAMSLGLWAGMLLSLIGLALAVGSARMVLGSAPVAVGASAAARPWAGIGLDLWAAGMLVGLLVGANHVLPVLARPGRAWLTRRGPVAAGLAAVALTVIPIGVLAGAWAGPGVGESLTVGRATLPAVAVDQADGPLSSRLLLVRPSDDVVDFQLVGSEPGALLRDLDHAEVEVSAPVEAVAALVGGHETNRAPAQALAGLGIGFVQVASSGDEEMIRRLDSTEGLSRLGSDEHGTLWKVRPLAPAPGAAAAVAPSRVRLVDGTGRLVAAVPTVGPHGAVDHALPSGEGVRHLVAAESPQWADHVSVTLDGRELRPVPDQAQPTYAVPASGGHLVIDLAAAQPWWRAAQAVLVVFVCFMAVPLGTRRSRRPA